MRKKLGLAAMAVVGLSIIVALVAQWFQTREREANLRRLQEQGEQLKLQLEQLQQQINGSPKR